MNVVRVLWCLISCCPPPRPHLVLLVAARQATEKSNIKVGAQNCFYELKGAFTGAVSAPMIKSVGCDYALVGHSERRKIFRETDVDINHALAFVQQHAITPYVHLPFILPPLLSLPDNISHFPPPAFCVSEKRRKSMSWA